MTIFRATTNQIESAYCAEFGEPIPDPETAAARILDTLGSIPGRAAISRYPERTFTEVVKILIP